MAYDKYNRYDRGFDYSFELNLLKEICQNNDWNKARIAKYFVSPLPGNYRRGERIASTFNSDFSAYNHLVEVGDLGTVIGPTDRSDLNNAPHIYLIVQFDRKGKNTDGLKINCVGTELMHVKKVPQDSDTEIAQQMHNEGPENADRQKEKRLAEEERRRKFLEEQV